MKIGIHFLFVLFPIIFFSTPVKSQDTLFLKNGTKVASQILEISPSTIKYKRADNMEGPMYSTYRSDVNFVKYKNGSVDTLNTNKPIIPVLENVPEPTTTIDENGSYGKDDWRGNSHKIVLKSGDLKMLKGETKLLLEYDFTEVSAGELDSEAGYLKRKRAELNDRESGKGDKYVRVWEKNKTDKYEPKFEDLFNKYNKGKIAINQGSKNAKYKLIVKTLTLSPGFSTGNATRPAHISLAFIIVETANPTIELARMEVKGVKGRNSISGIDWSALMQEAYGKAGKLFANYLVKNVDFE